MGGASGDRAGGAGEGGTGVAAPVPPAAVAASSPAASAKPKTPAETLLTTTSPNTATVLFRGQQQPYRTNLSTPQSTDAAAASAGPVPASLLYGDKTPAERADVLG